MKKWWDKFTAKVRAAWQKFKLWFSGLLIAIALMFAPNLTAEDNVLSWINATQLADDTPMAPDEFETIVRWQLFPLSVDITTVPRNFVEIARVPGILNTYPDVNVANGTHCYTIAHVRLSNGAQTGQTPEACKVVDLVAPGDPSGLTVN